MGGAADDSAGNDSSRADDVLSALPGLGRIAAGGYLRTAQWTVGTSLKLGERLLRAAVSTDAAAELVEDVRAGARTYGRELLGIANLDDRIPSSWTDSGDRGETEASTVALRRRGEELLSRSADVRYTEDAHPAYGRILGELAPDEGRILRLLALEGAQPAIDVRSSKVLNIGSQLVAPGLSMIGAEAGCRYVERVPAFLNNLYRLGLIWFSREPLEDPLLYQVLEAQPDVLAAMRRAGRGRTVRRSILLTPFGEDFCNVCLPLHTAELDALPGDVANGAGESAPSTPDAPEPLPAPTPLPRDGRPTAHPQ